MTEAAKVFLFIGGVDSSDPCIVDTFRRGNYERTHMTLPIYIHEDHSKLRVNVVRSKPNHSFSTPRRERFPRTGQIKSPSYDVGSSPTNTTTEMSPKRDTAWYFRKSWLFATNHVSVSAVVTIGMTLSVTMVRSSRREAHLVLVHGWGRCHGLVYCRVVTPKLFFFR